jgi:hypothetical protein
MFDTRVEEGSNLPLQFSPLLLVFGAGLERREILIEVKI